MRIEVDNVSFSYSEKHSDHSSERLILKNICLKADTGELIAFLGPNGVGKTTLFKNLLGFLKPQSGSIKINNKDVTSYSRKELAKQVAYIPQSYNPAFNHTVLDSVLMGTASQIGIFSAPDSQLKDKAISILETLGIANLKDCGTLKISGGERQLMLIARALIQDAHILIMDEPTSNLDFGNSYRVMERIVLLKNMGYTILMSTHNPSQATMYASRVIAMNDGQIIADGKPEILSECIIEKLYDVRAHLCNKCGSMVVESVSKC